MNNEHLRQKHGACSSPSVDSLYTFDPIILNLSFLFSILWEMSIYISLSRFISQMDREIKAHISEQAQRRRKRRNVIDLFGHIVHFALECVTILMELIFLTTSNPKLLMATTTMALSQGAILSIVLIAMSSSLKNELKLSMREVMFIHCKD